MVGNQPRKELDIAPYGQFVAYRDSSRDNPLAMIHAFDLVRLANQLGRDRRWCSSA